MDYDKILKMSITDKSYTSSDFIDLCYIKSEKRKEGKGSGKFNGTNDFTALSLFFFMLSYKGMKTVASVNVSRP